uniref:Uncharacterized protein At4g19900-like n=1 Tax=Nicotiana tabacum TaxID=4097 RepID=A0A1S3XEF2_TOBAC|nr:PREDICTED: uncharacterized protein At4g19900-like [Nicotiana tabacum]
MPNLDELLQDTPTHVFASVWYEWKQTKHYPLHYSELVRLAALYKKQQERLFMKIRDGIIDGEKTTKYGSKFVLVICNISDVSIYDNG